MLIKFRKDWKVVNKTVLIGEQLDVHWKKAIELINEGTADIVEIETEPV